MDWTTVIASVLTFLAGGGIFTLVTIRVQKKKLEAEIAKIKASVKSDEIENMRKAMESFYSPLVDEQNKRIASQNKKISELEDKVSTLEREKQEQAAGYQRQIADLQKQITDITRALGIKAAKQLRNSRGQYTSQKANDSTTD